MLRNFQVLIFLKYIEIYVLRELKMVIKIIQNVKWLYPLKTAKKCPKIINNCNGFSTYIIIKNKYN